MIELPESSTLARQIRDTLYGKTIKDVVAAQSPHGFAWYSGDPADYPWLLNKKTITDAKAHGGLVELFADEMRIRFNDGVNIRYLEPGEAPPKKHQLYILFEDDSAVVCTVQMYGGMMAYPDGTDDNPYYKVALEKPAPLTDAFDEVYFEGIVRDTPQKLSAKALLATEQRIPGLGNGCLQDILFNAKVNPQSKLSALSDRDLADIYQSLKSTLREMADAGGRDTEKDFFGAPGGYKTILSSKTMAYPCRECGGGVVRKAYMGGNVYFCPTCQPVLK